MTRGQAGSAGLQTGGRGPPQQQEARPRAAAATWPVEPMLSNVATRGVLKAREGTGRLSNPAVSSTSTALGVTGDTANTSLPLPPKAWPS